MSSCARGVYTTTKGKANVVCLLLPYRARKEHGICLKKKKSVFFFYSTKLDRFTIHKLSIVLAISGRHWNTNPLLCTPPPVDHCVEPVLIFLNSLVAVVKREAENKNLRLSRNGDVTIIKIIITITIIIFCQWIYERFFTVTIFWFYVRLNKYSYFNTGLRLYYSVFVNWADILRLYTNYTHIWSWFFYYKILIRSYFSVL